MLTDAEKAYGWCIYRRTNTKEELNGRMEITVLKKARSNLNKGSANSASVAISFAQD